MTVNREMIRDAFLVGGTVPGDTVVFHSSLKSMGFVEGGPTAVINGVLDAAGFGGTAAVPTLWYRKHMDGYREELFDPATSPAWNGAVAEAMRQDPRSVRSCHFTHSVSAIGGRAEELAADHGKGKAFPSPWSETAFAEISPWSRFYEWNALLGLIGVDAETATMRHWIESRFVARVLETLPESERPAARAELRHDGLPGVWTGFDARRFREDMERQGLCRRTPLGSAVLFTMRVRPFVEWTLRCLTESPGTRFCPEFNAWLSRHSPVGAAQGTEPTPE